jgi:hypothetical protein
MNSKLKPAILGGLVVGLLSAIPFINYCCCIWGIGGGVLAAYLYVKDSPNPVRTGEGAMLGGLAGLVGAVIYLIIGLPIVYLMLGPAGIEEQLTRAGAPIPFSGALLIIVAGLLAAVCLIILSVLGGLLGVAIFEKRKGGSTPPPPPEGFGGGGGPAY